MTTLARRGWLKAAGAAALGAFLTGCDRIAENARVVNVLAMAEGASRRAQRLIGARALAREFTEADISPVFKANGTISPPDADYQALAAGGFADWRLVVDGLVDRPLSLSIGELRALPQRTQITRHDCVEGWSAIGKWTGPQLKTLLAMAGMKPSAKYVVFHCADTLGDAKYYESLDLVDALHPQTILAWAMNGAALPVAHGAPLRLRAERHLGYKQAKYVMRIEAAASLAHVAGGQGGYWEDRGYEWYAGI
jgi:DMSO/TMAO reductase YedYZ molybdopterin-dependent catalytic subunit